MTEELKRLRHLRDVVLKFDEALTALMLTGEYPGSITDLHVEMRLAALASDDVREREL